MPSPIELCIELLNHAAEDERYYKCTARSGREAGLSIQLNGTIGWCKNGEKACDIWVSDDGRLLVHRTDEAPDLFVKRRGRELLLPTRRLAFLRNRDELSFMGFEFCIHVHGQTREVHAPRPVRVLRAAALAATLALSTAACNDTPSEEFSSEDSETLDPKGENEVTTGLETLPTDSQTEDTGMAGTETIIIDELDAGDDGGDIEIRDNPPVAI